MSHQLRTPLNAVIGYSEILLEDASLSGNDAQMSDLKRINRAGRHLLSLVTDVLDMSKIDSDDIELMIHSFGLDNFLDDVVRDLPQPRDAERQSVRRRPASRTSARP